MNEIKIGDEVLNLAELATELGELIGDRVNEELGSSRWQVVISKEVMLIMMWKKSEDAIYSGIEVYFGVDKRNGERMWTTRVPGVGPFNAGEVDEMSEFYRMVGHLLSTDFFKTGLREVLCEEYIPRFEAVYKNN